MRPKKTNIPIFKQAKDELKQATFLVLAPDEVDLHGDIYDADEVRKACITSTHTAVKQTYFTYLILKLSQL